MRVPRDHSPHLKRFVRKLRRESTDAEQKLWSRLRDRMLCGFKFRRQAPVDGYILDFYCASEKLAVELDGGQHTESAGRARDRQRDERLRQLGIRVLRFDDVVALRETDGVLERILEELEKGPSPRPSPGLPGEGE